MQIKHITTDRANIFVFGAPVRSVSWAVVGGGILDGVRTVVNWNVGGSITMPPTSEVLKHLEETLPTKVDANKLVVLFTSVPSKNCFDGYQRDYVTGTTVEVFATVGLGNRRAFEDIAEWNEEIEGGCCCTKPGTINLVVVVNQTLTTEAHLELLAIVAQVKTHVMESFQLQSPLSGLISSGTGTDCIAVLSPERNAYSSPILRFAGMHTTLRQITASAVSNALRPAIQFWLDMRPKS